jgi:flavin reductase (DIM6/NTAB) family NADH-FMN oxidoreductase RutF
MAREGRARARRPIDAASFRKAMGAFATGVTVVTVEEGEGVHGMTANAFMSGSLDPPLCLVSVAKCAHTHALIPAARRFGVTVLAEHQEAAARHFAGLSGEAGASPFDKLAGAPVLADGVARIAANLHACLECGDHTLFVGEVVAASFGEHRPLIYHRGAFRIFTEKASAAMPEFW